MIIDASFLNIPNSSLINNVPHKEPLYGLVLFFTQTPNVNIYSLTHMDPKSYVNSHFYIQKMP
jgi:hypothetical protein